MFVFGGKAAPPQDLQNDVHILDLRMFLKRLGSSSKKHYVGELQLFKELDLPGDTIILLQI